MPTTDVSSTRPLIVPRLRVLHGFVSVNDTSRWSSVSPTMLSS
jgi:hypothetical protein